MVLIGNAGAGVRNARYQPKLIGTSLIKPDVQLDLSPFGKLDCVSDEVDQYLAYFYLVRQNIRHEIPVDQHFES